MMLPIQPDYETRFDYSISNTAGGQHPMSIEEQIAEWVLDGGLTCMCCEPPEGEPLECEKEDVSMCNSLRKEISNLLDTLDIARGLELLAMCYGDGGVPDQIRQRLAGAGADISCLVRGDDTAQGRLMGNLRGITEQLKRIESVYVKPLPEETG